MLIVYYDENNVVSNAVRYAHGENLVGNKRP